MNGYKLVDYEGTGLIIVQGENYVDRVYILDNAPTNAFLKQGGKLIRFPYSFILPVVDIPKNRELLKKASYVIEAEVPGFQSSYIKRLTKTGFLPADSMYEAKRLKLSEVKEYVEKVMLRVGNNYFVGIYID